jgi:hypothetical protein
MTIPEPTQSAPTGLKASTRRWFKETTARWVLEPHHVRLARPQARDDNAKALRARAQFTAEACQRAPRGTFRKLDTR